MKNAINGVNIQWSKYIYNKTMQTKKAWDYNMGRYIYEIHGV